MITYKDGDIFKSKCMVIVQQVNCQGVMGSGFAKQIRTKYPNVYNEYSNFCSVLKDLNIPLLKQCQLVNCGDKYVANIFGQEYYGRDNKQYTDYNALKYGLQTLNMTCYLENIDSVAIPYNIGCGLGGGDWKIVEDIITQIFETSKVSCEIWKLI